MREYCVDLEIAQELKKNGFPQETCFAHVQHGRDWQFEKRHKYNHYCGDFACPTSDEILKELKDFPIMIISNWNDLGEFQVTSDRGNLSEPNSFSLESYDKKLSNALAKLWNQLKKEGYL